MIKKYTKSGIFYKVYFYETGWEFYFDWKPTKRDILKLCKKQGLSEDQVDYCRVTSVKTEDPLHYGVKLRLK